MPRKNYMTINAFDTVQQMFDEFVNIKDIPKTVALNDMLELYMLAMDEELYFSLKKKYLNVEGVKQMIIDKDSDTEIKKSESYIFMKLGNTIDVDGNALDGHETIATYISDESTRGYTWFSTQSLYYGMSQKRVIAYNNSIAAGNKVTILFCIGENAGGKNDIAYTAEVMEIISYKIPTVFPTDDYPDEWIGESARIWIKIKNIKPENKLSVSMFEVTSTEADLKQVISVGQFHFGYVNIK